MKPMLSARCVHETDLRFPVLASPKLDGIRCLVPEQEAVSRTLKPIPNRWIHSQLSHRRYRGLDGELIVGPPTAPDVYTRTTSAVMSVDGQPDAAFYIFDDCTRPEWAFTLRLAAAGRRVDAASGQALPLVLVPHVMITSLDDLHAYEASILAGGYEGIMVRDPNRPYKYGRSTLREGGLIKLKRFEDGDAIIEGVIELQHNLNPQTRNELGDLVRSSAKVGKIPGQMLGALVVRDCVTGVAFEIGTGFTALQRQTLWRTRAQLCGKIVKYKSQPYGVKDRPRLPVFLGFRDPRDFVSS